MAFPPRAEAVPPFGLASRAAWLEQAGCSVAWLDLAVQSLDNGEVASAEEPTGPTHEPGLFNGH